MESALGAALFLILVAASAAQDGCICPMNKRTFCDMESGSCICMAVGSNQMVDCSTLTSKCLLMKAEMSTVKPRNFIKPKHAFLDNDGLYHPECDANGIFKARQCNNTDTCWCVNSAGVRRTDKGDQNMRCSELVRTSQILIELRHKEREAAFLEAEVENSLRQFIQKRYLLHQNFIPAVKYDYPFIQIDLKQNLMQKSYRDVDIADVAYYFEKDIKHDSLFHSNNAFNLSVSGEPLDIEEILIYYIDEKAPEFSMKQLSAGIIAVVVVVVLSFITGITVLVLTRRRKTGKYEKVEIKEMREMRRGQNA
ncbi:tumor-associated calcium signal transducer 2 [Sceloporus undulatus]|uniref:tumor-associated calcium signal transducer 2 n=1 Tax=Sceloporus undulatus TaxID=8520 RepID=UPI001C4B0438|nr:tumor-associated calcium signal transducer 2 [Sceloporus undulatus]